DLYFDGKFGAPLDHAKSFAFAKRACDAGDVFGCALVGYHYQDGLGVPWARSLAVTTYDKACRAGAGVACFNLSTMYSGGQGVDADKAKGDAYHALAKQQWRAQCDGADARWCTNLAYVVTNEGDRAAARKLNE